MSLLSPIPRRDAITPQQFLTRRWDDWFVNLWSAITGVTGVAQAVPFNADHFTGGDFATVGPGTMTWTVTEANVLTNRYRRSGARLWWSCALADTVIGGTSQNALRLRLPGNLIAVPGFVPVAHAFDGDNPFFAFGHVRSEEPSVVQILKSDISYSPGAGNWNGSRIEVYFTIELEVQP